MYEKPITHVKHHNDKTLELLGSRYLDDAADTAVGHLDSPRRRRAVAPEAAARLVHGQPVLQCLQGLFRGPRGRAVATTGPLGARRAVGRVVVVEGLVAAAGARRAAPPQFREAGTEVFREDAVEQGIHHCVELRDHERPDEVVRSARLDFL